MMDKSQFEIVGNVGKVEIKDIKNGKIAILSVATSERWKREDGEWAEKTYWHRAAVFPAAKVARIEALVQKGTRLRLIGQIRPGSYEDNAGRTKYVVEFVVGPFGEVEVLARGKPQAASPDEPGRTVAELRPRADDPRQDPEWRAAYDRMVRLMADTPATGFRVGKITEDDKYGDAP